MSLVLYILVIAGYILYTRQFVNKMIPTTAQRTKQDEHLKRLRQDRLVDDFVLTGAAIPALENDIKPLEGYRVYHDAGFFKINGGSLIVISVSAEKLKVLLLDLMHQIAPVLSISLEDHYSDANKIIDYLSYDRELYLIENILDRYWRLLQNNYDVAMALFSTNPKVELVLTREKTLHLHAVDSKPFLSTLARNGFKNMADLRFFTEGPYYVYNDYTGTTIMHELISELEVHEKRFYEKVPIQ